MADICPLPSGYAPGLMLQLRKKCSRGDMEDKVQTIPHTVDDSRREAVVLVHGYNNNFCEAAQAYTNFRTRQYRNTGVVPPALESVLVDAFWPGDWGWPSFLYYAVDLASAKDAAPKFAEYLRSMPNLQTVHFIGHSMGCRLTLEIVNLLMDGPGPIVGKVCLMAAAVPDFMVGPGGRLADAIAHPMNVEVLYSSADHVLRKYFPVGQTFSDVLRADEGFWPTALGYSPPHLPGNTRCSRVDQADHSDYWPGEDMTSKFAASQAELLVGSFFNFGRMSARQVMSRSPASTAAPLPSRRAGANPRKI